MSSDQRSLEEIVRDLPPDSQAKVRQFVETLLEKTNDRGGKKLKQNWAGALSGYRESTLRSSFRRNQSNRTTGNQVLRSCS